MSCASIAICTHDRSTDVERCLTALEPQADAYGVPVYVVDSGSSEPEKSALEEHCRRFGAHYLRCDSPGVSVARNRAISEVKSEWIVFIDDDALPHPDWLRGLLNVLQSAGEDTAVIGGRIEPGWPGDTPPPEMTDRWLLLLSCVVAQGTGSLDQGYNVCGVNLAFRRNALEQAGGFPTTLGRVGTHLISGEEAYVIDRIRDLGYRAEYNSSFAVDHVIPAERLKREWVAKRAYWEGVSIARMVKVTNGSFPPELNLVKLMLSVMTLYFFKAISSNPDYSIRYSMARGSFAERLSLSELLGRC